MWAVGIEELLVLSWTGYLCEVACKSHDTIPVGLFLICGLLFQHLGVLPFALVGITHVMGFLVLPASCTALRRVWLFSST